MSKRRRSSRPPTSTQTTIPSSPSPSPPSEDEEWYAIKQILDERRKRGRLEYLVDWEGTDRNTGRPYPQSWVGWAISLRAAGSLLTASSSADTRQRSHPRSDSRVAVGVLHESDTSPRCLVPPPNHPPRRPR